MDLHTEILYVLKDKLRRLLIPCVSGASAGALLVACASTQGTHRAQPPVTIQRESKSVTATEKQPEQQETADALTKENQTRFERLRSYRVGTTTCEEFLGDKWNWRDPILTAKLGLVQVSGYANGSETEYTVGYYTTPDGRPGLKDAKAAQFAEGNWKILQQVPSATKVSFAGLTGNTPLVKICNLKFKDKILASCVFPEHAESSLPIFH